MSSDICVIGAGAAGITLARTLARSDTRVCLLESGGFTEDGRTQLLYDGDITGPPLVPLISSRLRYFGGTTGHWGGCCWPLEEQDFLQRDWVPYSGWPFSRQELDPYYVRAHVVTEIGPYNYDPKYWSELGGQPILPLVDSRLVTKVYQNSAPIRFGARFRREIEQSNNITAVLFANLVHIDRDNLNQTIRKVTTKTLEGKTLEVTAKIFVIATGGMENPRILLLNNIGNQNDLVGRFYMDHITLPPSTLLIPKRINLLLYRRGPINGIDIRGGLGLKPKELKKEKILNTWLGFELERSPESRLSRSWDRIKTPIKKGEFPDRFAKNVRIMLHSLHKIYGDVFDGEKNDNELIAVPIVQQSEQSPNPNSRVVLGEKLDELGQRKIHVDWRLTEFDYRSIRRTQEIAAAEFGKSNLGRIKLLDVEDMDAWTDPNRYTKSTYPEGTFHHTGTTRMHKNPKFGVVNENCRVHDTKNLYVAGSSTFPTSGYNNPTLTIVALAIRLADHLRTRVN